MHLETVKIADIYIDFLWNSRGLFSPESCYGLAEDIKQNGLLSPIMLRISDKDDNTEKPYCLVYGYRRLTAVALNNDTEILALINEKMTKEQAKNANIVENTDRMAIPQEPFEQCIRWLYSQTNNDAFETAKILGLSPTIISKYVQLDPKEINIDSVQEEYEEYRQQLKQLNLKRIIKDKRISLDFLLDSLMPSLKKTIRAERFFQMFALLCVLEDNNLGDILTHTVIKVLLGFIPIFSFFELLASKTPQIDPKSLLEEYWDYLVTFNKENKELIAFVRSRGTFLAKKKQDFICFNET